MGSETLVQRLGTGLEIILAPLTEMISEIGRAHV